MKKTVIKEDELQNKMEILTFKAHVSYGELSLSRSLICQAAVNCKELNAICIIISKKIVSYHRVYEGGKSHLDMEFDK